MKWSMEGKSYSKEEFLKLNDKCVKCGKASWYLGAKHCKKCMEEEE